MIKFMMGALPTPDMEWTIGRTAQDIAFMSDANKVLGSGKLTIGETLQLTEWIDRVKQGEALVGYTDFLTEADILDALRA